MRSMLVAVLAIALGVRLVGIDFGLPALFDPDEAFFMLMGVKLLANQTLNPGWFGHPGQTTIYMLALIDIAVVAFEQATGRFASVEAFARALYLDPSPVIVPARLAIVACGVGCVLLTYRLGRDMFDRRTGLAAAALLALNPLHVGLSQIIRTDVQSGLFLLLSLSSCAAIARDGRLRDYLLAACWAGIACATKWPAAAVAVAIPGGCYAFVQAHPDAVRVQVRRLFAAAATLPLALFAAGPFLLLDFGTARYNLSGEAKAAHLGSTGGGLIENLAWYVVHPLLGSLGPIGLALTVLGIVQIRRRHSAALWTLGVAIMAYMIPISASPQVWERWTVPVLPLFALVAAVGFSTILDAIAKARPFKAATPLLAAMMLVPPAVATAAQTRERFNDTRSIASAWAIAHLPRDSTLLVEHLAIDLLPQPWAIRFPAGDLGCVDVRALLDRRIGRDQVEVWRKGQPIVDIGTVNAARLDRCRADYAIFTDYDRYRAEQAAFPDEIAQYRRISRGGRLLLTVRPRWGAVGGPIVRVVRLGPHMARLPVGPVRPGA